MKRTPVLLITAFVVVVVGIIIATALLVPQTTNPAFALAVDFTRAALRGDEAASRAPLSEELLAYVAANCPDGQVTACIDSYIPDEWGGLVDVVYRRSIPQDSGRAWDIQTIPTFEAGQGFSGVCVYVRAENPTPSDATAWRITRWSGWVSCDEPNAGLDELRSAPDAPNRAP
ncbi:MAG: hypothetical protein MUC99_02090 [Anaerolineae bacterium]|jgi:hypothetical protein|nr:hypothetical protein [Anaerolineae bacterium]